MLMTSGHFSTEIGRMRMEEMRQRADRYRLVQQAKAHKDHAPDHEGVPPVGIFTSLYRKTLSLFRPRVAAGFAYETESAAAAQKRPLRRRGGGDLVSELERYMPAIRAALVRQGRPLTYREHAIGQVIQASHTGDPENWIAVVVSEDSLGHESISIVTDSEATRS